MAIQREIEQVHYVIYGIDISDARFIELSYDNGNTEFPGNWGSKLERAKQYKTYGEAYARMQELYANLRTLGTEKMSTITYGLLTIRKVHSFNEPTPEERMAEMMRFYGAKKF